MKNYTGNPLPQGCTVNGNRVNFSVSVPAESVCELILYRKGSTEPEECFVLEPDDCAGSLRHLALELEQPRDYEYNYRIDGEVTPDPRGKAFSGRGVWNAKRDVQGHAVRTRIGETPFDWEGDTLLHLAASEVVAYCLHVRGFTKHASSGAEHRGTFLGILDKLPYLEELGISQIHCMPVYEFEEHGKKMNYWGYGDAWFFAPKAAYAFSDDAALELKQVVKTLHKKGIELILEMPFTGDTPHMEILECLRYYVLEYHVDGFLVNPAILEPSLLKKDALLCGTKILKKQDDFQITMRRFLKGDEGMVPGVIWWLKYHSEEEGIFNYIASPNGFTLCDTVSYDGKHNEENGEKNQDGPDFNYSWNCGAEGPTRKKGVLALRKKQMRNAFFLLLLAQGMPCILGGDEFANSQKGNNNVYCQDSPVSWLSWNRLPKEQELHDLVRDLITFRKAHKLLHPDKVMEGTDYMGCGIPDVSYHGEDAWQTPSGVASRQLGVFYNSQGSQEEDCYIAYNMHWMPHTFALPSLAKGRVWYEAASTEEGVLATPRKLDETRKVEVEERSIRVFIGKQEEA